MELQISHHLEALNFVYYLVVFFFFEGGGGRGEGVGGRPFTFQLLSGGQFWKHFRVKRSGNENGVPSLIFSGILKVFWKFSERFFSYLLFYTAMHFQLFTVNNWCYEK